MPVDSTRWVDYSMGSIAPITSTAHQLSAWVSESSARSVALSIAITPPPSREPYESELVAALEAGYRKLAEDRASGVDLPAPILRLNMRRRADGGSA
jgi:hypothetical protein